MNLLKVVFGRRRFERPEPGPEDLERVDLTRMIAIARERGDTRTEPEVVAALMLGAGMTADRHGDAELRVRGAGAFEVCRRWLVGYVGEDRAAHLLSKSLGPIDEQAAWSARTSHRGDVRAPRAEGPRSPCVLARGLFT